jgi:hypothetical protein
MPQGLCTTQSLVLVVAFHYVIYFVFHAADGCNIRSANKCRGYSTLLYVVDSKSSQNS